MTAKITINGVDEPLYVNTVAALVAEKAEPMRHRGLAVALNGTVVPRSAWASTALHTGDQVEIVRVLQGG